MADKKASSKAKRSQTVRERAQASTEPAKPRRLRRTAGTAARPVKAAGKGVAKVAKPFAFLLKPFKTRPMRFIGRILAKVLLINYFKESWKELREVTWPNRKETWKLTLAVFLFAIVFGLVIALVDFGLDKLFRKILLS